MQSLRTEIEQMRAEGFEFPNDSWAVRVLKEDKRYLDLLDDAKQKWVPQTKAWEIKFVSSEFLDKYSCPEERRKLPLGDEAAIEIGHRLEASDLIKSVARARRRATGSMFPTHVE
ncbi:hypothetical protein BSKO_03499 [Bryopsis sp. KO-2023]|nr:hypothetical protein BSKO_03499 [Bryopsis sp. KO-2023]